MTVCGEHPFWLASGPGGIDDRKVVLWAERVSNLIKDFSMGLAVATSHFLHFMQREHPDGLPRSIGEVPLWFDLDDPLHRTKAGMQQV